jgi:hypothetical protein
MLSLGAVAFIKIKDTFAEVGAFSMNLQPIPGASPEPETATFWAKNPAAYAATQSNQKPAETFAKEFLKWARNLKHKHNFDLVAVSYPSSFDFMWVYWYCINFGDKNITNPFQRCPFGFSNVIDIKTLAWDKLDIPFRSVTKENMPKVWFKDLPKHDHVAVTDAREQGLLFAGIVG